MVFESVQKAVHTPLLKTLISLVIASGILSGPIFTGWAGSAMAKTHTTHTSHSSHTAHSVRVSHTSHSRNTMVLVGHGRGKHAKAVVSRSTGSSHSHIKHRHVQAAAPAEPSPKNKDASDIDDSQAQAQAASEAQPRLRNYSLLGNAYALYDQGVNERLKGNYGLSTDKLTESAKLVDQASSIERSGRASTLASMVFFELGLSAEADNDRGLARDSFVHAVKAKPGYVEAYLHLINVLATGGQLQQARNWLNDALRECPGDARLTAMQSKLTGFMDADGSVSAPAGAE